MGNTQLQTPNVIMLGLDGAGKTTLLYKLLSDSNRLRVDEETNGKTKDMNETIASPKQPLYVATIGYNVEIIASLKVTDIGGGAAMRALWKNYFKNIKGIIFVFDSNDKSRMTLCRNVLHFNILNEKQLKSLPLLIYCNKTDLSKVNNKQQIINILQLNQIKCRKYSIHCISAINNSYSGPLLSGFKWLTNQILSSNRNMSHVQTYKKSISMRTRTCTEQSVAGINLLMERLMMKNDKKTDIDEKSDAKNYIDEENDEKKEDIKTGLKAIEAAVQEMEDSTLCLVMFGLCGAGKTTLIYHLKYGCFYSVARHLSYDNIQFIDYNGINIGIYECDPFRAGKLMEGNDRINALIFVIDGNDRNRFDEIKTMLTNCILLQNNNDIPLLIIVNTRNADNAQQISRDEIMDKLDVFEIETVECNINDIVCIRSLYNIEITEKILKIIITYLPKIERLKYKYKHELHDCCIHFVNGFTGNGIKYGMDWILSNAKTTQSQKLYIASNSFSKSKADDSNAKFLGDTNVIHYSSSTEYLDELMSRGNEMEQSKESIFAVNRNESGSVSAPIAKSIW